MIYALLAIASVLAVGSAFGFAMRGVIAREMRSKKANEKTRVHSCDGCKYEHTNPNESPCKECADDDIDLWTPAHIDKCDSCRHRNRSWLEEPCVECTGDKWEERRR